MNTTLTNTGRLLIVTVAVIVCLTATAPAQVVRPVVSEFHNPAKGWIEYYNDGAVPLTVFIEARSFTMSATGEMLYRPLDSGIHLRLSAASFRIPPKETYYLSYEAAADQSPVWFVIYAAFSGFPVMQNGISARLWLPHTVYLLPKQSMDKTHVHVQQVRFDAAENKVYLDVANTSDYFGRVLETRISYLRNNQDGPGFPLYPHSHRVMEFPLEKQLATDDTPITVVMQFQGFKIRQTIPGIPVRVAGNSR